MRSLLDQVKNIDSIHKEIIKTIDFKDTTKDDLQDRINILLINEKLINKINRNLNSYSVNEANTNTGRSQYQVAIPIMLTHIMTQHLTLP